MLALRSALPGTEKPLWDTLDVSYFARHDAADIAWHARSLWRHVEDRGAGGARAAVAGGRRAAGAGLRARPARPVRAHLRLLRRRRLQHPGRQGPHQPAPATRSTPSRWCSPATTRRPASYRDLISLVETQLAQALQADRARCPSRAAAACRAASARSRSRRASRCGPTSGRSAGCCRSRASDRSGLLYAHRARAGAAPHQPAAGQDHHAGRARRGHLPRRRPGAAAEQARRCRSRASCSTRSRRWRRRAATQAVRCGEHQGLTAAEMVAAARRLRHRRSTCARRPSSPKTTCPAPSTGRCSTTSSAASSARCTCRTRRSRRARWARRWWRATSPRTSSAGCRTSRATGSRWSTAGAAASARARWRWFSTRSAFAPPARRRLQGLPRAVVRDARRRCRSASTFACWRAHRQRQDAAAAARWRDAGAQVLDLEALACHRGSVLGWPARRAAAVAEGASTRGCGTRCARFDPRAAGVRREREPKVGDAARARGADRAHARHGRCLRVELPDAARVRLLLEDYGFFANDVPSASARGSTRWSSCAARSASSGWQAMARAGASGRGVRELMREHYDPLYLNVDEAQLRGPRAAPVDRARRRRTRSVAHAARELLAQ